MRSLHTTMKSSPHLLQQNPSATKKKKRHHARTLLVTQWLRIYILMQGTWFWSLVGQPTPVFLPGKSHGQRSLAGYGPWCHNRVSRTRLSDSTATSASPVAQMVKNLLANTGDQGSIPGLGRFPWRRAWQPTLVFLPGEFHGQRIMACYSP